MPTISLVVCLYKERDLLERLLQNAEGCYDDLVVVHDGPEKNADGEWRIANGETGKNAGEDSSSALQPSASSVRDDQSSAIPHSQSIAPGEIFVPSHRWPEMAVDYSIPEEAAGAQHFWVEKTGVPKPGSVHEIVARYGGRFFEGPRCWQQEPHWPFAWSQAKHDWILRLDADEFPTAKLRSWLEDFRKAGEPVSEATGYTCVWPLWDGQKATSDKWPAGRLFLFERMAIQFFGMAEQSPIPDTASTALNLVLNHQPCRKSYGVRNILLRKQAYRWRAGIVMCLLRAPIDLPRWRWNSTDWPKGWQVILDAPLLEAFYRLCKFPLEQARSLKKSDVKFSLSVCLNPALHYFCLCLQVWKRQKYPFPMSKLRRAIKKLLLLVVHEIVRGKPPKLETLGGICPWTLSVSGIDGTAKVLSGGVGGDISFELDLSKRSGCSIALFDPSPTGMATIDCLTPLPAGIEFHAKALSASTGTERFAQPFDAVEGSFREPIPGEAAGGEWPSISIGDFMKQKGWGKLNILKLDIEGFEFDVIDSFLSSRIPCEQLLVEFHYGKGMGHSIWEYLWIIIRLRLAGYFLVHRFKSDHTFLRKEALLPVVSPQKGASIK